MEHGDVTSSRFPDPSGSDDCGENGLLETPGVLATSGENAGQRAGRLEIHNQQKEAQETSRASPRSSTYRSKKDYSDIDLTWP